MTTPFLLTLGLALALQAPAPTATPSAGGEQQKATEDPHTKAYPDGIIWYGTWEGAMAEMERTGKPVMLHMGSPRERISCVPGTW